MVTGVVAIPVHDPTEAMTVYMPVASVLVLGIDGD
jgi:hypothetical protein